MVLTGLIAQCLLLPAEEIGRLDEKVVTDPLSIQMVHARAETIRKAFADLRHQRRSCERNRIGRPLGLSHGWKILEQSVTGVEGTASHQGPPRAVLLAWLQSLIEFCRFLEVQMALGQWRGQDRLAG